MLSAPTCVVKRADEQSSGTRELRIDERVGIGWLLVADDGGASGAEMVNEAVPPSRSRPPPGIWTWNSEII